MEETALLVEKSVLLIIDMDEDGIRSRFPERNRLIAQANLVRNSVELLQQARACGLPAWFVGVRHAPDGSGLITPETGYRWPPQKDAEGRPLALAEGSQGARVIQELTPRDGELFIAKQRWSAFCGTALDILLRNRGFTTLLLAGFATNFSIESTARDARDLGYNVVVLRDCCAGLDQEDHEWTLRKIMPRFARVMTSSQAFDMLR